MKLALWLPHLKTSGGVRVILTYANVLARLGHEVIILAAETSRKRRWWFNLFKTRPKWFKLDAKIKVKYLDFKQIDSAIKEVEAEILVADSWPVAQAALVANLNIPVIHTVQHDERLYHGDREVINKIYQANFKKVVVSTWLQGMFKNDFNQDAELLLNSFDQEIFKPVPEAKVNDGKIRVLLLDHPYKWKGTAEGVKMVKELKLKYPNLILMGLGARGEEINKEFDEFYFSPAQSELAAIYSRAHIFLCPSWDEGFGLPSLEAMACGTAVATYDNGGSRDFALAEKTALVSPRQDYDSLKNNLERLITDQDLRHKIAQGGYELTQNWPAWPDQARRLEKILKSAITL